jgi:hypothetical protein
MSDDILNLLQQELDVTELDSYGTLLAALRKDLQLNAATDILPNTFQEVSGLVTWITPTLLNGWANYGGTTSPAAYLKDPFGFVHFRGSIAGGATGTNAFVLPAGYRPGGTELFPALCNAGLAGCYIVVDIAGDVNITTPNNTYQSLQIPPFLAEN